MVEDGKGSEQHAKFTIQKPDAGDTNLAKKIAGWTQGAGNMLPKTDADILALFEQGNSVVVMNQEGEAMTHAAITYTYPDGSIEVGGLYTDQDQRGKGGGTYAMAEIIEVARERHPENIIFALANEQSKRIFEKLGGRQMHPSELHEAVWEPCQNCPRNPQKLGKCSEFQCCDTPYDVTTIKK